MGEGIRKGSFSFSLQKWDRKAAQKKEIRKSCSGERGAHGAQWRKGSGAKGALR